MFFVQSYYGIECHLANKLWIYLKSTQKTFEIPNLSLVAYT